MNVDAPMRVLVIDDDVAILRAIARNLKAAHQVTTATSASEAFLMLASNTFDVILCDLHMPDMNGDAFVAKLSALDAAHVVFMSGAAKVRQGEFAEKHLTLLKPFTKSEMFNVIDRLVAA